MSKQPEPANFYRQMLRIRRFEETVLDEFSRGQISGTTHTYIGQEANAVGVLAWLEPEDVVVSNHRGHGHFLAYGGPMHGLAAELMGRETGVCGGRGGSQHVHWKNFYANGILGGTVPLAVGMAFAEKHRATRSVVFAFMGDGTVGQGVVYESFNLASLLDLPVFFILENNRYAQSTPIQLNMAGDLAARFRSFGIPVDEVDTTDVVEIYKRAQSQVESIRAGEGARALIVDTYRFAPHSKGDDTRDPDEIARYQIHDPLLVQGKRLSPEERGRIESEINLEIEEVFRQAERDPVANPSLLSPPLDANP